MQDDNKPVESSVYGDLSQFKDLVTNIELFGGNLDVISKYLPRLLDAELYEKLGAEERVERDVLVAYCFSSLCWMLERCAGRNPASSRTKLEIDRVKQHSNRFKLIKERKTMPRLDKQAASRFVRSGLWTPGSLPSANKRKRQP